MNRHFRKVLGLAFISSLIYLSYKVYLKIKGLIELDKTLPQYLENVIGEKPEVNITYTLNKYTVSVCFSKEILEKNKDLETTVLDYISDFYPMLKKNKISIELVEKEVKDTEKSNK